MQASNAARAGGQQYRQATAQQKSSSTGALGEPVASLAAMEQRRGSGAGPFGGPLNARAPPQDREIALSDVFSGNDGWRKSGWRS